MIDETGKRGYSTAELEQILQRMEAVSAPFYFSAIHCGNHAFIEFTGLMNEYIKVCRDALKEGVDFTEASTHTGVSLPMKIHHIAYLYEKLDCIYGPSIAALKL